MMVWTLLVLTFVWIIVGNGFKKRGSVISGKWSHRKENSLKQVNPSAQDGVDIDSLFLTPVLKDYTIRLRNIKDSKMRYEQLLFFASQCPPFDQSLKITANRVPGCQSTVYTHATKSSNGSLWFTGDSDSRLTKGLLSMLLNGLSGHTAEEIARVNPRFIQYAGITTSLTAGRNNGFLNMLGLMKQQAQSFISGSYDHYHVDGSGDVDTIYAGAGASGSTDSIDTVDASEGFDAASEIGEVKRSGRGMYDAIVKKLTLLQPTALTVEDDSKNHIGHSGVPFGSRETHFKVNIVAKCFAGLTRVQRHQMVYTLLAPEMQRGLHALSISAKHPSELPTA